MIIAKNDIMEDVMGLLSTPPPEFFICWKKIFADGEEHVTRIYRRSVLILMLEGELSFLEDRQPVTVKAGEYYIQKQGLLQEGVKLSSPPTYYYIEFSGSFDGESGLSLRGSFDRNRITALSEKLYGFCKSGERNDFYLSSQMMRIFAELGGSGDVSAATPHLVKRYIESEYASDVSLSLISKKFGYTEDHITRIFKKEFGITPHAHLTCVRLEHAKWLLENTDLSVGRVAYAVGYRDFSAFWRAFKKKFKVTPRTLSGAPLQPPPTR